MLRYLSKNQKLFHWQKHQRENCTMREAAGTMPHPQPAPRAAEIPSMTARQQVWASSKGTGQTVLLNLLHSPPLTLRKLLELNVSPKGCEIIPFTFKETDLDTQKRRKNWQLFSLIIMSRKCCPASPCFVHRQNTAADQSFDFLFHDQFFFP